MYEEIVKLKGRAKLRQYLLTEKDIVAISFMLGLTGLRTFENKKALKSACEQYDRKDAMKLLDTIKEVFIDLEYLDKE